MKTQTMTSVVAAALLAVPAAHAAQIALYIDGADYADSNTPAAASAAGVTASGMAYVGLSGGFGGPVRDQFGDINLGGNVPADDFWYVVNANQDLSSDPGEFSALTDDYFGFTLTADAGSQLDLNTLTFDWGFGSNDAALTGTTIGYRVFASVDGGSFVSLGVESFNGDVAIDTWVDGTAGNYDLNGLGLTTDGGSVEFRVQTFSTSSGGGVMQAFQNISVDGALVAVPEPSSTALIGLAGLGFILRRRR